MPTAGHDYPGSHGELLTWFPDDHACIDYLEWLRWPDGFRCPRCVSRAGWRLSSGRWECAVCARQTSVTAGTIFHRTGTPLSTWFAAAWLVTAQKQGVSALGLLEQSIAADPITYNSLIANPKATGRHHTHPHDQAALRPCPPSTAPGGKPQETRDHLS